MLIDWWLIDVYSVKSTYKLYNIKKLWIKIYFISCYTKCFLSEFFPVQRGCRQGDPLSPYIFLLCAEILALMLKSNEDIQGIKNGGEEYKLSQFADDTTILLDEQEKSLVETMKTLRLFASLSGLKINSSKTKAVWIGSKKICGETFNHRFKFEWNQKEFTILGIRISCTCNLNNMIELNYKEKLSQIEKELKSGKNEF